jgi:hypothetical protein
LDNIGKQMARKTSKKAGKAKAGKTARSRPLVAGSGAVRRAPRPARQPKKASEPSAGAFPLMNAMHRLAMANIDHAGRLAACRTPVEFWLEHIRFGQTLFAQWQSSAQRTVSRSVGR